MAIHHCTWDDCDDVADYVLHIREAHQPVGAPQAVCVVHLADAIVNTFAWLRLEGPSGAVVQVEPAE